MGGYKLLYFNRQMVIVQEPNAEGLKEAKTDNDDNGNSSFNLTLINTCRLSEVGLRDLSALGRVRNIVRLGAFHGIDDAFYTKRYPKAKFWAIEGQSFAKGLVPNVLLEEGKGVPVTGSEFVRFKTAALPEGVLLLPHMGGTLITVDSVQHSVGWFDTNNSVLISVLMGMMGFVEPCKIGPGFVALNQKKGAPLDAYMSDFDQILALKWVNLIGGHGVPCIGNAKQLTRDSLERTFKPKPKTAGQKLIATIKPFLIIALIVWFLFRLF